ncbi:MAG TPA: hypothetical protein PKK10_06075 [Woeseiaceae bacterium]|nr:hypothetical protein [Woeseiaceae bacterium]
MEISLNCAFWHSSGIVEPMKFASLPIVVLAVVALLLMQFSGLHLHAGDLGDGAALHGTHVHDVGSDGHDHTADVDVSLIDFGIVWSKIMPVLMAILPVALAIVWVLHTLWPPPTTLIPLRRRSRWRPPLRAPPLTP